MTTRTATPTYLVRGYWLALLALAVLLSSAPARAVPSFAQQTGMACQQCHTTAYGPALTDYGRQFKLNGYVFGENRPLVPLALMVQGGYTRTSADQPEAPAPQFGVNGQTSVDQVSLFIASRLTSHLGLFAQITYDGIGHVTSWDNTDLRYSRSFNIGSTALTSGVSEQQSHGAGPVELDAGLGFSVYLLCAGAISDCRSVHRRPRCDGTWGYSVCHGE